MLLSAIKLFIIIMSAASKSILKYNPKYRTPVYKSHHYTIIRPNAAGTNVKLDKKVKTNDGDKS